MTYFARKYSTVLIPQHHNISFGCYQSSHLDVQAKNKGDAVLVTRDLKVRFNTLGGVTIRQG